MTSLHNKNIKKWKDRQQKGCITNILLKYAQDNKRYVLESKASKDKKDIAQFENDCIDLYIKKLNK